LHILFSIRYVVDSINDGIRTSAERKIGLTTDIDEFLKKQVSTPAPEKR
jgi:hypothetical protein